MHAECRKICRRFFLRGIIYIISTDVLFLLNLSADCKYFTDLCNIFSIPDCISLVSSLLSVKGNYPSVVIYLSADISVYLSADICV